MNIPIYEITDIQKSQMNGDHFISDFHSLIEKLVSINPFDEQKEIGISKLVLEKGTKDLTDRQIYVLKTILGRYNQNCSMCSTALTWGELDIYDQSGLCNSCNYDANKVEK